MPIRTRSGPVSRQGSVWSALCASSDAATASHGDENTAIRPSPVIFTTRPPAPSAPDDDERDSAGQLRWFEVGVDRAKLEAHRLPVAEAKVGDRHREGA